MLKLDKIKDPKFKIIMNWEICLYGIKWKVLYMTEGVVGSKEGEEGWVGMGNRVYACFLFLSSSKVIKCLNKRN